MLPYAYTPPTPEHREKWRRGTWEAEPDQLAWTAHGYHCAILRHGSLGHLCGYVGVPPSHIAITDGLHIEVHGGITYDYHNQAQDVHWLGFDCAHSGDLMPNRFIDDYCGTYRTFAWTHSEVERLAEHLYYRQALHDTKGGI